MDKHEVKVKVSEDVSVIFNIPSELSGEEFRSYDVLCMSIDSFVKTQLTALPKRKKVVKTTFKDAVKKISRMKKKTCSGNRLTSEQRIEFKKMYMNVVSATEIAAKLNLRMDTVKALFWRVNHNDFPNWWNRIQ